MTDRWVDEQARCGDPECLLPQPSAQPEADGDLRYYACECGYEFGYKQARQGEDAGTCQLGVPEEVRRQFQAAVDYQDSQMRKAVFLGVPEEIRIKYSASQPPGVLTLVSGTERRSVFLGVTIKRRPE